MKNEKYTIGGKVHEEPTETPVTEEGENLVTEEPTETPERVQVETPVTKGPKKKKKALTMKMTGAFRVNIRSTPADDDNIITTIDRGELVFVDDPNTIEDGFIGVRLKNGTVGFAMAKFFEAV